MNQNHDRAGDPDDGLLEGSVSFEKGLYSHSSSLARDLLVPDTSEKVLLMMKFAKVELSHTCPLIRVSKIGQTNRVGSVMLVNVFVRMPGRSLHGLSIDQPLQC
jgi:hypothetical protein